MRQSTATDSPTGYGLVAKALHWLTFLLLVAQFMVGYAIDRIEDLAEPLVDRWLGGEDDYLVVVHASLGVVILVLASARVVWRRIHGLPPWAETLISRERRFAHWTERILYLCLFLIPLTGIALVLVTGEDWDVGRELEWRAPVEWIDDDLVLGAHIVGHLIFFTAFAAHLGLVLKHQMFDRDRLFRRML